MKYDTLGNKGKLTFLRLSIVFLVNRLENSQSSVQERHEISPLQILSIFS